jgi:CubicO group peptidase (beta-lactamase class C family)
MPFRSALPLAALAFAFAAPALGQPGKPKPPPTDDRIADLLKEVREKHDVPAIAAAVVTSKGLTGFAAVGVRDRDAGGPVTPGDKFHLGSNTKMMTAYVIAALAEKGRLKWDDPLEKLLPQAAKKMRPDLRKATLAHLTAHRAGLIANPADGWPPLVRDGSPPRDQRSAALEKLLAEDPVAKVGEKYHYSNIGYVVAATAAERAGGRSWEAMMASVVFKPLEMTSAGFGIPGRPAGPPDQPRPHNGQGKVRPTVDNPAIMGPSGNVHCSVPDWAKFAADVLRGARGRKGQLTPASYKRLLADPFGDEYTVGGWVPVRDGYWHNGSNTVNYAKVHMDPARDVAILVATNQGGSPGRQACDEVVRTLLKRAAEKP